MTEKYRELNLALEFLDAIDTTELSEENAGNVIEAHGYLSTWLEDNTELPQQFEVGEYYVIPEGDRIYKVLEKLNENDFKVNLYSVKTGNFMKCAHSVKHAINDKPATAVQIAEFTLAEYLNNVSDADKERMREMLSDGKMPLGAWMELNKAE